MLSDLYDFYLSKKTASDDNNYLARALTFNQDEVVNLIDNLPPITSGLTPSEVMTASWSGLLYAGSSHIFTKFDALANRLGANVSLAEQLTVPFTKSYGYVKSTQNLIISQKEFLFGYHHEKAMIVVKGEGSFEDARKALREGIARIAAGNNLPTRMRKSVDEALKITGENLRLNQTFSQSFLYLVDKAQVKQGVSNYENSNKAIGDKGRLQTTIAESVLVQSPNRAAKPVLNSLPHIYEGNSYPINKAKYNLMTFEAAIDQDIGKATRLNYFGGLMQSITCVFLIHGFFSAKTQGEKISEGTKAVAGLMALVAGSLELRSNSAKVLHNELKLKQASGVANLNKAIDLTENKALSFSKGARLLGIGSAAIFAGFDVNSALKARANDDNLMGSAYIGSAVTGFGSTVFLMMSGTAATGIGVVLLIGFIGINLFIGYWKKTGMENWLKHGIWGTDDNGWSLKHTLEQFDRAVVGEDIDLKDN